MKEDTLCQTEPGQTKMISKWLSDGRATKETLFKAVKDAKLHLHHIADNYLDNGSQSRTKIQLAFGKLAVFIDTVVCTCIIIYNS